MASTIKVDKLDPQSGTALEIGTSGDTVTVPTGAGLTVVDEVKTNKISPATGTAFALGDSGDTFTVPSGATIVNSGTATGFGQSLRPNVDPLIINGDMAVAQRATSTASVASNGYHACDRWRYAESSSAVVTISQDTDVPTGQGFASSFKIDCTTADASLGAAEYVLLQQKMEGRNLQLLKKGTSSAQSLTLSFWVKSTKTGTFIAMLYDRDNTRQIAKSYTVSVSDTWEQKTITYAGDTTGALDNDNAASLELWLWLGVGSNYSSGSLATSWETETAANQAVGQVNAVDSTSNNFLLTGVQLEVGEFTSSTIPSFQHESYGNNLERCLRYYHLIASGTGVNICLGGYNTNTNLTGRLALSPMMRSNPTLDITTGTDYYRAYRGGGSDDFDGFALDTSRTNYLYFYDNATASGTAGYTAIVNTANSSASMAADAEM